MTFLRRLEVPTGPQEALHALAQACQDVEAAEVHLKPQAGVVLARTGWIKKLHFGYHLLGRVRPSLDGKTSTVAIELTPFLGGWAGRDAEHLLDELARFTALNASAPASRLKPYRTERASRPHAKLHLILSITFVLLALIESAVVPLIPGWVVLLSAGVVVVGGLTGVTGHGWRETMVLGAIGTLLLLPMALILIRLGRLRGLWNTLPGQTLRVVGLAR